MPRRSRIQMLGKRAARERQERVVALQQLERTLRGEWNHLTPAKS